MRHIALFNLVGLTLHVVFLTNASLHCRPFRDPVDPFKQVRERLHVLLLEAAELPRLYPRPCGNVRDAVLSGPVAYKVLARLAGVFAGELDLEDAVDTKGLVFEAIDRVCKGSAQWSR